MSLQVILLVIGVLLLVTAVFSVIVALSAREIDLNERIFKPRKARRMAETPPRVDSQIMPTADMPKHSPSPSPPPPSTESYDRKKAKRRERFDEEEESLLVSDIDELAAAEKELEETVRAKMDELGISLPLTEESKTEEAIELWDEDFSKGETVLEEEAIPEESETAFNRDLSIKLPKNMCLDEVFKLKITILKSEEYSEELTLNELKLDKKEAKHFALTVTKLGEKVVEATTRLTSLEEGSLIIRPIAIGNVAVISPSTRTIYFTPEEEAIEIEFFITPTRWTTDIVNTMRIEFEQNFKIIKKINIPIKIYKRKLEALFGLNLSKWQQYAMFVYSAIGAVLGLIGALQDKIIPAISNWFT